MPLALSILAATAGAAPLMSEPEARRFLGQTSFGPTEGSVQEAQHYDRAGWLELQFAKQSAGYNGFSYMDPNPSVGCPDGSPATCKRDNYSLFPLQTRFFRNALTADDQLRQRVALALSEILVTSGDTIRQPYAMANYQRIFLDNAFGNYRDILYAVTLSPAMGDYLDMVNNDKPNPKKGSEPNENYAREVMQLFSIGLTQLNADGTPKLGSDGKPQPSYSQDTVEGFAHVFTGWAYAPRPGENPRFPGRKNYDGVMLAFADHHDDGSKQLLSGVTLPAGQGPQQDLDAAIDNLFNHPNVGPFIGRQLIQQLVTSNPSPAYVARVAAAFNHNAQGKRGDMKAVLRAILLDPEAQAASDGNFGKLREPILQITHFMRALGGSSDGVYLRQAASDMQQPVFDPPSVFNFYTPNAALPGNPSLKGPPFGIYGASTAFNRTGFFNTVLSTTGVAPAKDVPGATGTRIDLTRWQTLAANPSALVAELNRVLLGGTMSAALQTAVYQAIQAQPVSNTLGRARTALFMVAISPEYSVEH
ncbi:DUF1800 domain-containing protein [Chitinimonas sp.]|uniref:DUF1800 domain-containing protein n=1 Tax=Chitinimonas sp. TaxID=1934313 RepID=UPI002F94F0AA